MHCVDVHAILKQLEGGTSNDPPVLCMVLATGSSEHRRKYHVDNLPLDGVWDNWRYEDLSPQLMDKKAIDIVFNHQMGLKTVCEQFMQLNAQIAKKNFGSQADNATSVLLYITMTPPVSQS